MKNRLGDLNDHLFAQLERLAEEGLDAETLERECKRAESIVALADQVTANAATQLAAARLWAQHGAAVMPMLPRIGRAPEETP